MRKVELTVPEHDVVSVTEVLAASGAFHLVRTEHLGSDEAACDISEWQEWATTFAGLERRILAVMEALGVDEGPPPSETPHLIRPSVAQMDIEHLEQEAQAPIQELDQEQHKLTELQQYLGQLKPIASLDVDLDTLRNLRYTLVLLGTIPLDNLERFRTSLENVPYVLVTLRRDEYLATVALIGARRDADILKRAARSAYLNPLSLPDEKYRGTPAEAIAALQSGIQRKRQHVAEAQANIEHLREMRIKHLRHLVWRVRASRKLVETIAHYGRMDYSYVVAGWVPASQARALEQKIGQVSNQTTIQVSTPREEDARHIPVALENPSSLKAFQNLVTNYGYPRYGELDPTLLLALTFPLVFGFMFGDVGHGLLLTLLGLLLISRRVHALHALANLGAVLTACGVTSTLFGFLYGSIFGFETVLEALWIRPLEDIMDILVAAVAIGAALLSLGMLYNVLNAALARRWGRLLFDRNGLAGLAFYWSLIGLAASASVDDIPINPALFATLAAVSALAVAFAELLAHLVEGHRPLFEGSFGTYLMQAFFELFEAVISLLSNTLSYVRMGAFAVAHGGLSLVVFIMAEIVSPSRGVGYWIVVALGNLFVIGFEGMIVGIQTLRLEYYEFFSKFFSGSGVSFHPLTLIAKGE